LQFLESFFSGVASAQQQHWAQIICRQNHEAVFQQMLENVPEVEDNLIKVPTIVDKEDAE